MEVLFRCHDNTTCARDMKTAALYTMTGAGFEVPSCSMTARETSSGLSPIFIFVIASIMAASTACEFGKIPGVERGMF